MLDGVFMISFPIVGHEVSILMAVCKYLTSPAIVSINLICQEHIVFNAALDRMVFRTMASSHRGWRAAKVTSMVEITLQLLTCSPYPVPSMHCLPQKLVG
jgi:hypothetical protein